MLLYSRKEDIAKMNIVSVLTREKNRYREYGYRRAQDGPRSRARFNARTIAYQ